MSRDNIYAAQMRDKFAREALMDLPKDASPELRQSLERRAADARRAHALAAANCQRQNKARGIA